MNEARSMEEIAQYFPQANIPVEHFFTTGIYTRQATLLKGTLAVGKKHRDRTLNVLIKGKLSVCMSDESEKVVTMEAPCAFESDAGVMKAVYCDEDCILLNVHRTDETDLAKLEEELIVKHDDVLSLPVALGCHIRTLEEQA